MARVLVFDRALDAEEVKALAVKEAGLGAVRKGCLVALDFEQREDGAFRNEAVARLAARIVGEVSVVDAGGGLSGKAVELGGKGYLEIAHDAAHDCAGGVTLAAWIRPRALPPSGARIIDKSPVGAASAYLLDTYPGSSLRVITRDPHVIFDAKLPALEWTHVAGTVDGETGRTVLYVNGRAVKTSGD
jgi:hypothetical protein